MGGHIKADVSDKTLSARRLLFGAVLLAATSFLAGAAVGPMVGLPLSTGAEPIGVVQTFKVFWESWNLVQQNYVNRAAVDPTKMTYGAIQGMLDSLGDIGHTRFLTPTDLQSEMQSISGSLEGIGAQLVIREQGPTILAPLPDSPAQRAGILPGDTIVRVDGKEVAGLSLDDVVRIIRGPAGTTVTLTVLHPGATGFSDISVERAKVTVPSVTSAMLPGTTIAHVLVSQFSENTNDQLAAALTTAEQQGATGVVFDLRNNPGGLRDQAIAVASEFIPEGKTVLVEQDAKGNRTDTPAKSGGVALDIPLVTLINEGTASSSEIVAGALQDEGRAKLVGATTVGTGTVLSTYRLSDGSALLLGTKQWLTPNGHEIWHHGITPDVPVALPPSTLPLTPQQERDMTADAFKASGDTQLLQAVSLLTGG